MTLHKSEADRSLYLPPLQMVQFHHYLLDQMLWIQPEHKHFGNGYKLPLKPCTVFYSNSHKYHTE